MKEKGWIGGGTGQEETVFLRALKEVLSPIENPRYLLARRKIWRIFREDYFAVPDALARKKEFAEQFAKRWSSLVGRCSLSIRGLPRAGNCCSGLATIRFQVCSRNEPSG